MPFLSRFRFGPAPITKRPPARSNGELADLLCRLGDQRLERIVDDFEGARRGDPEVRPDHLVGSSTLAELHRPGNSLDAVTHRHPIRPFPTILLCLRRPKIRPRLTDPSGRNIITSIRGSERWVAGFKSESRPASDRNRWPASYWNWWPASSESAGRAGFLGQEAKSMSAPARRAKVERTGADLSVRRQCFSCSTWRAQGCIGRDPSLPPPIWVRPERGRSRGQSQARAEADASGIRRNMPGRRTNGANSRRWNTPSTSPSWRVLRPTGPSSPAPKNRISPSLFARLRPHFLRAKRRPTRRQKVRVVIYLRPGGRN